VPKAVFNGIVIAQSDTFEEVEGNVYFPPEAAKDGVFQAVWDHNILSLERHRALL